jgi:hypothetical protein
MPITKGNALREQGGIGISYSPNYTTSSNKVDLLLSQLTKVKKTGHDRWIARCANPNHDDRNPSMVITAKPDGVILIHCFGCGASGLDVCNALGIDSAVLFPPSDNPKYTKQTRQGFSAWQLLHALKTDLTRLLIITNDLKKHDSLSVEDQSFIVEVILRLNNGLQYLEGAR